jgi:hypothetical protein
LETEGKRMTDPANNLNIAVFIDADNVSHTKIDKIYDELSQIGTVSLSQAYGNWCMSGMDGWKKALLTHSIQAMQQFSLVKSKNAADMELTIGAMEALFTRPIDVFCIVSSDCDFTPLARRLRSQCKQVIGFGNHDAATPYVSACTRFVYLNEPPPLPKQDVSVTDQPTPQSTDQPALQQAPADVLEDMAGRPTGAELKKNQDLMNLLLDNLAMRSGSKGWARLGDFGELLSSETTFSQRDYGYKRLCDFLEAIDLFEVKRGRQGVWVRQKPRPTKR